MTPKTKPNAQHRYYFIMRRPEEVYDLAVMVSSFFPHPETIMNGIYELLFNALEHGNLGIGFLLKGTLVRQGKWQDEFNHRLSLPENADKTVRVEVIEGSEGVSVTIEDDGRGFNWQEFLGSDILHLEPNGRGLMIATNSGFQSIHFNPAGNAVTCCG